MWPSAYNTKYWPLGIIMAIYSVKFTEPTFSSHDNTWQSLNVLIVVSLFVLFAKAMNFPSTYSTL